MLRRVLIKVRYLNMNGLSQKQIADKLDLSVRTAEGHADRVKTRLKCRNKNQLFEFAFQHGLMSIVPQSILD